MDTSRVKMIPDFTKVCSLLLSLIALSWSSPVIQISNNLDTNKPIQLPWKPDLAREIYASERNIDLDQIDSEYNYPEYENYENGNNLPESLGATHGPGNDGNQSYNSTVGQNNGTTKHSGPPLSKHLPQAIIIGVKKAGTRALIEFLRIHPDVRAPGPEPHFFDKNYHMGFTWYRDHMPLSLPGQLTIEKSPSYFITPTAPKRISQMDPTIKLILIVRDPVTRAISDYTQTRTKRPWVPSFEERAFLNNGTGVVDTSWGALRIGMYARHLVNWLQYFPLSRIHVVSGENLVRHPAQEMLQVQRFLELSPVINETYFYFNSSKGFPCLKKPEDGGRPRCLGKTKGRTHVIVEPKALERLRDFFRPLNDKFYQMVGRHMHWQ